MENPENNASERKEKPPVLNHGSFDRSEELEPRTKPHREKEEGKLIFATPHLEDAVMFLQKAAMSGHLLIKGERIAYALIVDSREDFEKRDKGGHVYVLPSDTFEPSPHKGMSDEWVSKEAVQPLNVLEYPSALEAMIENGVQVYFVDLDTYRRIRAAEDHGYSIYQSLQSENQRRGVNVKEFK